MTSEQIAILRSDHRRHLALADACTEPCMREQHVAIAEALAVAIEEGEGRQCKSVIKCVSLQMDLVPRRQASRFPARTHRRRER